MGWISVKDKLPETGQKVIALDRLGWMRCVYNGFHFVHNGISYFQVTYWIPDTEKQ